MLTNYMVLAVGHEPESASPVEYVEECAPGDVSDRFTNPKMCPWYRAYSERARAIVTDIVSQYLRCESVKSPRSRARRSADLAHLRDTIDAFVSNAVNVAITNAGAFRLNMDNNELKRKTRYRASIQTAKSREVLHMLGSPELKFLTVTEGTRPGPFGGNGRQTTVAPGVRLLSRVEGLTLEDFRRIPGEEIVMLKDTKNPKTHRAELVDYDDTETDHSHHRCLLSPAPSRDQTSVRRAWRYIEVHGGRDRVRRIQCSACLHPPQQRVAAGGQCHRDGKERLRLAAVRDGGGYTVSTHYTFSSEGVSTSTREVIADTRDEALVRERDNVRRVSEQLETMKRAGIAQSVIDQFAKSAAEGITLDPMQRSLK